MVLNYEEEEQKGIAAFYNGDRTVHVSFSKDHGKIAGIASINTNPLINPFCHAMMRNEHSICHDCYAVRALKEYRMNAVKQYTKNSMILSNTDVGVEGEPIVASKYCRINAFGELHNATHWLNIVKIVKANSHCKFSIFTKRMDLIQKCGVDIPYNLLVVYSNPKYNEPMMNVIPRDVDVVYNVVEGEDRINCDGKCIECLNCYDKLRMHNTIVYGNRKYRKKVY